jgi:hypothetical protein
MSYIDTEIAVTHYTRPDIKVPGLSSASVVLHEFIPQGQTVQIHKSCVRKAVQWFI